MSNPTIESAINEIRKTVGTMESAKVFIGGEAGRLQAAVDAALANGATAEELAPVQAEVDSMIAKTNELASAIAANP